MNKQQSHDVAQEESPSVEAEQPVQDFGSNQARGERAQEESPVQEEDNSDSSFHSYGVAMANSVERETGTLTALVPKYIDLAKKASFGGGRAHTVSRSHKRRLRRLEDDMEEALESAQSRVNEASAEIRQYDLSKYRSTSEGRSKLQRLRDDIQEKYLIARRWSSKIYRARKMLRQDAGYTSDTAKSVNLGIKSLSRQLKGLVKFLDAE